MELFSFLCSALFFNGCPPHSEVKLSWCVLFKTNTKMKQNILKIAYICLGYKFIGDWSQEDWFFQTADNVSCLGWCGLSLHLGDLASSLSFFQESLILLHTLEEVLSALWVLDMLNTDVDAFGNDSATHSLVHNNTEGVCCDIVYATSFTMVYFVWHTFLDCSIALKKLD